MPEKPSTRREFLYGKSAAEALSAVGETNSPAPGGSQAQDACTLTLTRRAMACDFEVQLPTNRDRNETEIGLAALDLVDHLEDRLSVYRPDSELCQLNSDAQLRPVEVNHDLFALLCLCDSLHGETQGAFDATTGPLSRAWGFFERKGRMPSEQEILEAMRLVGWRHIELDEASRTLRITTEGVEVSLNGIGKGYALDQAADLMLEEDATDFLLHGGRSTLVARGNRPSGEKGWGVGLRHPLRPDRRLAEFALRDQAFSTSGAATQGFVHQGKRYGHVLDPRTGWPASGVHSVSVLCPTGAEADALSTALFVMGLDEARKFCDRRPDVGALFVLPDRHASSVRIEAFNLPEAAWRPVEPE